jgi:hypothetical protein
VCRVEDNDANHRGGQPGAVHSGSLYEHSLISHKQQPVAAILAAHSPNEQARLTAPGKSRILIGRLCAGGIFKSAGRRPY